MGRRIAQNNNSFVVPTFISNVGSIKINQITNTLFELTDAIIEPQLGRLILFYTSVFCQATSEPIEQLEIAETFDIRSADSTILSITIKLNYAIKDEADQSVLNLFGQDYSNKYIMPLLRKSTRKITFSYSLAELTEHKNSNLEKNILNSL